MRFKMRLELSPELLFDGLIEPLKQDYYVTKQKPLPDLYQGFSYSKDVTTKGNSRVINMASVKVLKYDYPKRYRFEYRSRNIYKVSGFEIERLEDGNSLITVEEYQERLNMGKSKTNFTHPLDEEDLTVASFFKKREYYKLVKQIKQRIKEENRKEKQNAK